MANHKDKNTLPDLPIPAGLMEDNLEAEIERRVQARVAAQIAAQSESLVEARVAERLAELEKEAAAQKREVKYKRIMIAKSGNRNDRNAPVFVGANGTPFQLHRGVELIVPEIVTNILNNAVETTYEYDKKAGINVGYDAPVVTFNVLGDATAEDYRAQRISFGRPQANR